MDNIDDLINHLNNIKSINNTSNYLKRIKLDIIKSYKYYDYKYISYEITAHNYIIIEILQEERNKLLNMIFSNEDTDYSFNEIKDLYDKFKLELIYDFNNPKHPDNNIIKNILWNSLPKYGKYRLDVNDNYIDYKEVNIVNIYEKEYFIQLFKENNIRYLNSMANLEIINYNYYETDYKYKSYSTRYIYSMKSGCKTPLYKEKNNYIKLFSV